MKRAIFTSLVEMSAKSPVIGAMMALRKIRRFSRSLSESKDSRFLELSADLQQRREIEELLKSGPSMPAPQEVQQAMAVLAQKAAPSMQQGQPPPPAPDPQQLEQYLMKPTVPIDPVWDFHQQHIQTIQDWLASQDRFDEEAKGNFPGIENVKLHGMAHKQALQAQQTAPQGKPPSVSINYADLPPDGQVQAAAEAGIHVNPIGPIVDKIQKNAPKPVNGAANA